MMPAQNPFDDIAPNEADAFTFDFARLLNSSETIVSAVWTLVVDVVDPGGGWTRDPSPSSRLIGSAATNPADPQKTIQKIGPGCYPGNRYLVTATATTSSGNLKVMFTTVWCRDARGTP